MNNKPSSGLPVDRSKWVNAVGKDLPFDAEAMFPRTTGYFVTRANDRRVELLDQLKPVLAKALWPNEEIRYAARTVRYDLLEAFFAAHLASLFLNQIALVLTDQRLLIIYVDSKGRPADIKNQVRLSQILGVRRRGLGSHLMLKLQDGTKLDFVNMARRDRDVLLAALPMPEKGQARATRGEACLEYLCPSCLKVVPGRAGNIRECPNESCRVPFRSARKAASMSLVLPGVGEMYLRHFYYGIVACLVSLLLTAVAAYFVMVAWFSGGADDWAVAGVMIAVVVLGPRLLYAGLTLHMGHKGIVQLDHARSASHLATHLPARTGASQTSMRALPVWAYVFVLAGVLATVAVLKQLVPSAQVDALLSQACNAAQAGHGEEALRLWQLAQTKNPLSAADQARLARDLYVGGDRIAGDQVLGAVGDAPFDKELAEEINGFLARARQADDDYSNGLHILVQGNEQEAWPLIDRALAVYAKIKRPALPADRDAVLVHLVAGALAPPVTPQDLGVATRFFAKVGGRAPTEVLAVLSARMSVCRGKKDEARRMLMNHDTAKLAPTFALLELETEAALSKGDKAWPEIAARAARISTAELAQDEKARRVALVALGGKIEDTDDSILTQAAEMARAQGFTVASGLLKAAVVELP